MVRRIGRPDQPKAAAAEVARRRPGVFFSALRTIILFPAGNFNYH
jgi:hypothetical protein